MIAITVKFRVLAEAAESWPSIVQGFTSATRAEPGCLWFDWSRSLDDPTVYHLIEAFADDAAGAAHVSSEHFARAQIELPASLVETPLILHVNDESLSGWSRLTEFEVAR